MPDTLTPALDTLKRGLGTSQPYVVGAASLTGTNLLSLLEAYLSAPNGLSITSSTGPVANQATLQLAGTADVLSLTGASVETTFVDSAGGTGADGNRDLRAIDIVVTIAPAISQWAPSTSFPALAGTVFDQLSLTGPVFVVASMDGLPVTIAGQGSTAPYGLSFAAEATLTGPLASLATLTGRGPDAGQPLEGPIAFTSGAPALPCLALALPSYPLSLSPFPTTINLAPIVQSMPGDAQGTLSTAVTLTAPMSIEGVGSLGLSGPLPPTGPITLDYALLATPVGLDALAWWGSGTSPKTALPAAIQGFGYSLTKAAITLAPSPAAVSATRFDLLTGGVWSMATSTSLKQITASLQQSAAATVHAIVGGYVPVPDSSQPNATVGVPVLASSDDGFPDPIVFLLGSPIGGVVSPALPALVGFLYPSWGANLPADVSALGAAITITAFTVTVSGGSAGLAASAHATDAGAAWTLAATPQPLALKAISIALAAPAGTAPSGTISGTIGLGSPATPYAFAAAVTGTAFSSYSFALGTGQTPTLGQVSASLCGSATPTWLQALQLDAGTLALTPGVVSSLTGTFHVGQDTVDVPVPTGGTTPSTLGSFTGLTISSSGSTVSVALGTTWTIGGASYAGTLAYPYTSLALGDGNSLPIPEVVNPSGPPDPDRAIKIVTWVISGAGAAVTVATIAAAIWAAVQAGGYTAAGSAASAVAPTIWQLLRASLWQRARWLIGGVGATWLGTSVYLSIRVGREGSNGEITPNVSVQAAHEELGTSAADAGRAVRDAYSLDAAQLAPALAPTYPANETAAALRQIFPDSYPTAQAMIAQLTAADVYGAGLTPTQMATALAASGYAAGEVAPALLARYGSAVDTTAEMAPVLQDGWQQAGMTLALADMIAGLAACAFAAAAAPPAVLPLYGGTTLDAFAAALVTGYQAAAPVSAMQLAIGLAAAGQATAAVQAAVQAALPTLQSDRWTAIAAVAFASGQPALLAAAVAQRAAAATLTAAAQAIVAAQPTVALDALAGDLYAVFSAPNQAPATLATALRGAFGSDPPAPAALSQALALVVAPAAQDALEMITLLAAAGYPAAGVGSAVAQAFPASAGTAALLAPLLQQGYDAAGRPLAVADMAGALAGAGFNVLRSAPAVVPLYPDTALPMVAEAVVAAWSATQAPSSALQLGQGLAAAGQAAGAVGPALHQAMPALTAAQMTAVLAAAYDSGQAGAATLALQQQADGKTAGQAAQAMLAATPQLDTTVLAGVLSAVFSPPNMAMGPLAQAVATGYGASTPVTPLGQALPVCFYPAASTALAVAQALVGAISGVTAVDVAAALKADAFARGDALSALTGAGFSSAQATQAIIQVYGGTVLKLVGNASNVTVPTALAPSPGTSDFSLELWIQASTGQGGVLMQHQAAEGHQPGFNLQCTPGGTIAFTLLAAGGSSTSYQNDAPVTLYDGEPHHLAATRQTADGVSTIVLYLDGRAIAGSPASSAPIDVTATASLTIGATGGSLGGDDSLVGFAWNVCLWSCALSAAAVAQHQAAGSVAAPQANLVGFWPMTDGGTDDQSGNGQNGVLSGGAAIQFEA